MWSSAARSPVRRPGDKARYVHFWSIQVNQGLLGLRNQCIDDDLCFVDQVLRQHRIKRCDLRQDFILEGMQLVRREKRPSLAQ